MKNKENTLKPMIKNICSDIWTLHSIIQVLEKENQELKDEINKLKSQLNFAKQPL